jgi:hypothetical protein
MGANQAKLPSDAPWDHTESEILIKTFSSAAKDGKHLDQAGLGAFCQISPWLSERLFSGLKRTLHSKKSSETSLSLTEFSTALAKCCSGSRIERREFLVDAIMCGKTDLHRPDLQEFMEQALALILPADILRNKSLVSTLAAQSTDDAFDEVSGSTTISSDHLDTWLSRDQGTEALFSDLMASRFLRESSTDALGPGGRASSSRRIPRLARTSSLLRDEYLWALSGLLPQPCTQEPWRLLFSSNKHGKAFSRFVSRIIFKGPTVIVVSVNPRTPNMSRFPRCP